MVESVFSSDCSSFPLQIVPQLQSGKNVMIAAHGNSLRSIIMYLDKLTSQEVIYHLMTLVRPFYTPTLTPLYNNMSSKLSFRSLA